MGNSVIGHARISKPADGRAEQAVLINGLRCARVTKLWRTVSREHNQWHIILVSLDHRCMKLGRRGAARTQQKRRDTRRPTETNRRERRRTLVVKDMDRKFGSGGYCEGHGRRARPGRKNGMADAALDPRIDKGGAKGGSRRDGHCLYLRSVG